jgi:hypothetical protein
MDQTNVMANTVGSNTITNTSGAAAKNAAELNYTAPEGYVAEKFTFRETTDPDTKKVIPKPDPVVIAFKPTTLDQLQAMLKPIDESADDEVKLTTAKIQELILSSINEVKRTHIRKVLFDDLNLDEIRVSHTIDPSLYDIETIALMPPARRGAVGIEEELWEDFTKNYIVVIQEHGMDEKRAKVGADILRNKLNKVKQNKDALQQFAQRIDTWYTNTQEGEKFESVYKYLADRVQKLIVANEPQNVLASF